jgi:hypothetical protein
MVPQVALWTLLQMTQRAVQWAALLAAPRAARQMLPLAAPSTVQ